MIASTVVELGFFIWGIVILRQSAPTKLEAHQ